MEYEGRICRGPMERSSYMLPVAVGCSYNACKFCTLFKHLTYRELPIAQIEEELKRVRASGGAPKQIFLGDGNPLSMSQSRMVEILELIHSYFPNVERINMDATVTNIAAKSDAELDRLRALGVDRFYLGIESGLADVLELMAKDHHTPQQAIEQIDRLHEHGMSYAAHIMTGVAGKGRGLENAEAMAQFINRTRPEAIVNFSMFVHKKAPIWQLVEEGRFSPADELECLMEDRRIIELLDVDGLDYDGMHDCIEYRVRGRLPGDRERMLKSLDDVIAQYKTKEPIYSIYR